MEIHITPKVPKSFKPSVPRSAPWDNWDLNTLIKTARQTLTEVCQVQYPIAHVEFTIKGDKAIEDFHDENMTWTVTAIAQGLDLDTNNPEKALEPQSNLLIRGHGKELESAFRDLLSKVRKHIDQEVFRLESQTNNLQRTLSTVAGEISQLSELWSSEESPVNLADLDDLIAWLENQGEEYDNNSLRRQMEQWRSQGSPKVAVTTDE